MVTFNLVVEANEDEVRNVAAVEIQSHEWEVVLCFDQPGNSLDFTELEEIPVHAAVRRLALVLWRLLDYAADSFPPAPDRLLSTNLAPSQEAALSAGERVASLVCYLTEYTKATLSIKR